MFLDSSKTPAINEHVLSAKTPNIRLIDIGSRQHQRKKNWTPFFEDVISVIYVVDLDAYDAPGVAEPILDSLRHFNKIIHSRLGYHGSIILLLANQEEFANKLARSPLEKYFPDYEGGADPAKAAGYIAQRFASLNRGGADFYTHLVDNNNPYATLRFVRSVVKDTIMSISLKSSILLMG
jgi:guanine nucleotide-binding protein G(i) subunit alpha